MKHRFGTYILVLVNLLFGAVTGIGFYQLLVVMPQWFTSPPASFARINANGDAEISFWIPSQIALLIALIVSLIFSWSMLRRRNFIFIAFGCYILVWIVTAIYFAPTIIEFGQMPTDAPAAAELTSRANMWLNLQWGRMLLLLVGNVASLLALAATSVRETE